MWVRGYVCCFLCTFDLIQGTYERGGGDDCRCGGDCVWVMMVVIVCG